MVHDMIIKMVVGNKANNKPGKYNFSDSLIYHFLILSRVHRTLSVRLLEIWSFSLLISR